MSEPLTALLRALQQAGLDIDAEAALDSVWLGLRMQEHEERRRPFARTGPATDRRGRSPASTAAAAQAQGTEAVGDPPGRDSLAARSGQRTVTGRRSNTLAASARALTLARASALPESRDLLKALRPLRRRVVSPGSGILDVDATVRRAAEEDLWFPTFASARERWLDVLLVADHGLSMILWKDTIDEFERVLRNSGAFRSVRSWWLESDSAAPGVTARGRGPAPSSPEHLTRLTRNVGRSIVLVLSDCVGDRWHDGTIPRLIGGWSRTLPVGLMQVTPDWFWARTALGDTVNSELRSAVPAVVNHRYRWDARALGAGAISIEESDTLLRMPAITLTAGAVGRFAGLVAGVGREWAPGVVFDLAWQALEPEENGAPAPAIDAAERVARFGTLASRAAQRLAAAFAASPVRTLGVLRLLRRDLVPDAGPFTEAEVMLGGILRVRREDAQWESGVSLPLEFVPGVQPLLLDGAIAGDVIRVLTHAAAVAESGVGPTFTSWLTNPSSGTALLDPAESAFAASAAQVLERLGGTYAQIVKPGSRRPLDDAIGIAQRQEEDPPRDPLDGDDDRVMSVEFVINGRVQGVGFRYFGQQQANELGLEGDVRNLPDGRVRMHARGPRSRLKELQNRLRQGPPGSTVHDLVTTVLPEPVRVAWGGADRAVVAIGISRVGGLPRLDSAPAAARKVADWALASQGIPADSVTLLTDDDGAVEAKQIVHAVRSAIEAGHTRQLVLYFCGYAISVNRDEHWLLSNAPEDPNAAVNLHASVALARYAGIPHVVFISDTCRVSPESVGARVVGGEIFPSMSSERPCDVDQFYAVGGWQKPLDVKMEAVASQSRAAYTEVLLSALGGGVPSLLEEEEGVRFVRPQTLARYLETAMREHMSSQNVPIQLAQQPDARIESDRGAWLAAFADPTRRGRMDIQA